MEPLSSYKPLKSLESNQQEEEKEESRRVFIEPLSLRDTANSNKNKSFTKDETLEPKMIV